jgi:CRP-like cAMP-binding protein
LKEIIEQIILAFDDILTCVHYKKGELVQECNTKSDRIYILKSGLLRSYYFQNGNDITAHFATEYSIIGAIDSLLKKKKSIYAIEALEDSEVLLLNYYEMESFLDQNPQYERLARQVSQLLYLDLVERLEGMMFLSAKERYDHFNTRYPNLNTKVNLGHIASYLGITQETLSRVRKMK